MSLDVMSTNPVLRARRIEEAWAAYEGNLKPALKVGANGENDNVPSGLARTVVDGLTSWTLGREIEITTDGIEGENKAEQLIDEIWPTHTRMIQLQRARTEGGVTGAAFLRVLPDRVIVLPSEAVSMITNPMDTDQVDAYVVEWEVAGAGERGRSARLRQTHLRREDGGWTIRDEQEGRGGKWALVDETAWDYTLPQIVHCANMQSSFAWGMPDLEDDVIATIRQIQRALSNAVRIVRLSAHPIEYTRGLLDDRSRAAYEGRSAGAVVHLADESQQLGLSETTGKGLDQALALSRELKRHLHAVTGLPDFADPDTAAQISGASGRALELRLAPLTQKVEILRRNYEQLIIGVAKRVLLFNGLTDETPRVEWPSILPADPLSEVQHAQALMDLGASHETVLTAAGLDASLEAERLTAEEAALAAGAPAAAPIMETPEATDQPGVSSPAPSVAEQAPTR